MIFFSACIHKEDLSKAVRLMILNLIYWPLAASSQLYVAVGGPPLGAFHAYWFIRCKRVKVRIKAMRQKTKKRGKSENLSEF